MTWVLNPETGTFSWDGKPTKKRDPSDPPGPDYPSRRPEYRRAYHQRKYRADRDYRSEVQLRELRRRRRALGMPERPEQGSECEICGRTENGTTKTGSQRRMHLDHDHATGEFRGWLCNACNTGIGMFRDNPDLLRAAIGYLRKRQ
jgi:hypothetical protein